MSWELIGNLKGDAGNDGVAGISGSAGLNGWSPVLAVVADGARSVLRVSDWTGGTGSKPPTGSYLGASGFTSSLASAIDIRGAIGPTPTINPATTTTAGSMSAADKTKLNGVGVASMSYGSAAIPLLAAGLSSDVTVTFATPLSGTSWAAQATPTSSTLALNLAVPTIKSITATGCVVTLKNNALVSLSAGAVVEVFAYSKP